MVVFLAMTGLFIIFLLYSFGASSSRTAMSKTVAPSESGKDAEEALRGFQG